MKKINLVIIILVVLGVVLLGSSLFIVLKDNNKANQKNEINEIDKEEKGSITEDGEVIGTPIKKEQCVENICISDLYFAEIEGWQYVTFDVTSKNTEDITIKNITITTYNYNDKKIETFLINLEQILTPNKKELVYVQFNDKKLEDISKYTFTYE